MIFTTGHAAVVQSGVGAVAQVGTPPLRAEEQHRATPTTDRIGGGNGIQPSRARQEHCRLALRCERIEARIARQLGKSQILPRGSRFAVRGSRSARGIGRGRRSVSHHDRTLFSHCWK
jgi:hypothetical protein